MINPLVRRRPCEAHGQADQWREDLGAAGGEVGDRWGESGCPPMGRAEILSVLEEKCAERGQGS